MKRDVVILGSGFAGSILARILATSGRSVTLVERARHPRFALGESSTPLAALALERLAYRYRWRQLADLAAYGRWSRSLPSLRRGLKRGFTFYGHEPHRPFDPAQRLLVAASPEDELADAHWLREDVDAWLVEQAREAGVEVLEDCSLEFAELLESAEPEAGGLRLHLRHASEPLELRAGFVVDAAGGALARALGVRALQRARSTLIYTHARGIEDFSRAAQHRLGESGGGESLQDEQGSPWPPGPYPDHWAAVHHLVEEGWIYVLPFDDGRVSFGWVRPAGAPLPPGGSEDEEPAAALQRLLRRYPDLHASLGAFEALRPLEATSFRHRFVAAVDSRELPRYALLPQAFCFADPMFSTGMAWSLLAVERLAAMLSPGVSAEARANALARYGDLLQAEADQVETLIAAAYAAKPSFSRFTALTFLYFAAVSHQELKQRLIDGVAPSSAPLDPAHPSWRGFLGAGEPRLEAAFAEAHARLSEGSKGLEGGASFESWVTAAIEPFNAIGLADPARRNLYPVDLDALRQRADRLGLSRSQLEEVLPRLRGGDFSLAPELPERRRSEGEGAPTSSALP